MFEVEALQDSITATLKSSKINSRNSKNGHVVLPINSLGGIISEVVITL